MVASGNGLVRTRCDEHQPFTPPAQRYVPGGGAPSEPPSKAPCLLVRAIPAHPMLRLKVDLPKRGTGELAATTRHWRLPKPPHSALNKCSQQTRAQPDQRQQHTRHEPFWTSAFCRCLPAAVGSGQRGAGTTEQMGLGWLLGMSG